MSISGLVTALQFLTRLPVPKALGAGTTRGVTPVA